MQLYLNVWISPFLAARIRNWYNIVTLVVVAVVVVVVTYQLTESDFRIGVTLSRWWQ